MESFVIPCRSGQIECSQITLSIKSLLWETNEIIHRSKTLLELAALLKFQQRLLLQ